ncbi:MAG: preprotein translocase subunit TatC [Naasia sp.]|jgi:sec-independent protein translocase protein TatC|uniref:twin-arginine translocase subunit TatC n=1 Tax=Naasia sp. TaxID=2546198 RepID=UPI0026110AED|nr:twin-arginine translocase subunit TatC [Naasia sp.]MCU1571476.1 preprotein translocase subunit TatC [Naasia sp.]
MSLGRHLIELRNRLYRSALAVLAGAVAGWFLADYVFEAMRSPLAELALTQGRLASINFDRLGGAFDLKLQIAFTLGIIVSSPIWLYQIFAFFVPALSRTEKRYTFGFFLSAVPIFLAGCAAGWFVLPHIVSILAGFAPAESSSLIQANDYFTFLLKLVLAVGVGFVLPVFLVLLDFLGVLSGRTILTAWRTALLAILIFSAIATPAADVMSMFLLAVPMAVLYLAAAGVSILHDRQVERRAAQLEQQATAALRR